MPQPESFPEFSRLKREIEGEITEEKLKSIFESLERKIKQGEITEEELERIWELLEKKPFLVETDNGRYLIVLSEHTKREKPERIGNPDALVLETGALNYTTSEKAEELAEKLSEFEQYKDLMKKAAKEKIPIYFVDQPLSDWELFLAEKSTKLIGIGAGSVFLGLLYGWVIRKLAQKRGEESERMSRREFLERFLTIIGAASIAAGVWGLKTLPERLTPGIIKLRNIIIAYKLEEIAKRLKSKLGRKPEISVVIGAAHFGLIPDLEKIEAGEKSRFRKKTTPTIVRLDFDEKEGRWKTTEIFEAEILKKLVETENK